MGAVERGRAGWFMVLLGLITVVADGYSGKPNELVHQLLLLPITILSLVSAWKMINARGENPWWGIRPAIWIAVALELLFVCVLTYEFRHFRPLGYQCFPKLTLAVLLPAFALLVLAALKRPANWSLIAVSGAAAYLAGMTVAIASFPLNYLRSDMLPVILWADTNLLHHINPYRTMYVGGRVYDFPYLPGMMLAYIPAVAAHMDIRLGSVVYLLGMAAITLWAARSDRRTAVAALLAGLLVCPFLQYRHELYLQPHWFWMLLSLALMQRRRFGWSAITFGFSMAIYQFSWVIFPFFILNAFWRRGWTEVLKLTGLSILAALAMDGAFLASAYQRVASNTVGQWNLLPRAVAEPMNLSYWLTYVIAPAHLQRFQAVVMVALFAYCIFKRRCSTTSDAVRWMVTGLGIFIMLNVIVDGYFYLTWLVLAFAYVCIANGWWWDPAAASEGAELQPA